MRNTSKKPGIRRRDRDAIYLGVVGDQVPAPNPPHDPPGDDEALRAARYEAEQARAEAARLKREMDDIRKQLPTEEQRAHYAELEEQHRLAEENRAKKEGDFASWRTQIVEKHDKDLQAERAMRENAEAKAKTTDRELDDTLIGREFADASELFGPTGRTVLLPEVAQSYFAGSVEVQAVDAPGGGKRRRVVVKDASGAVIVDPKTGTPMPFAKAMGELIDAHPRKEHLLRNSGKVGSGSPGGAHGGGQGVDTSRLKPKDFQNPDVREAVREQASNAGGLVMGPAFDRMRKDKQAQKR